MRVWTSTGALILAIAGFAQPPRSSVPSIVYEGARLIVGDGRVIERSAFVVEGEHIAGVGQQGSITAPARAAHVDLSGKTVMPALIDVHTHLGYRRSATFSAANFTRETILDELDQFAARGVAAVASAGTD